jgi:hypothetical protein
VPFTPFGFAGVAASSAASALPWPWLPADNALLGASEDLSSGMSASIILVAGTLYLVKLPFRAASTVTNIIWGLTVAGVGASTGSFTGLYNSAGTLLSGSADIASQLTGALGGITCPLTTPQSVQAGTFGWAAMLVNLATTQPTLLRAGGGGAGVQLMANFGLTAAVARFATNGTALAALPASVTPASNNIGAGSPFLAGWS